MIQIVYGHSVTPQTVTQQPFVDNTLSPVAFERVLSEGQWRAFDIEDDRPGNILTLDDGFRDNKEHALSILERYDVPAILFVTTGFVDGTHFPIEIDLARLLSSLDRTRIGDRIFSTRTVDEKNAAYRTIRSRIRGTSPVASRAALEKLAAANDVGGFPRAPEDAFLSWEEVEELDRHPLVTIGAHSHSHPLMMNLNVRELVLDLWTCRILLENHLRRRIELFAYPYGSHSWLSRTAARILGFRFGFTTEPRTLTDWSSARSLQIPRCPIQSLVRQ